MSVVLWILQGLLAMVMLMAGGMKLAKGKEGLREEPRMAWVGDFSDSTIRLIGLLEVAAGVGLILPWWLDIAPIFTPLAAVGVVAIMLGAMFTHRRRGEMQMIVGNVMLGVMAAVIAIGRFGDL